MPDKNLRAEITELTEAVRELRDREVADTLRDLRAEVEKLRAERASHQCACTHVHWYHQTYPASGCAPYVQPQIWYTSVGTSTVTTTNAAAGGGYNPDVTTFSISN